MGKFLKDSAGNLVAIDGGLVLERTLDRKPRDCESCGYNRWVRKDKVFIIQGGSGQSPSKGGPPDASSSPSANNGNDTERIKESSISGGYLGGGSMEWICPDCALKRGLPVEFYHKNFYAPWNPEAGNANLQQERGKGRATRRNLPEPLEKLLDMTTSLCHFKG